MNEAFPSRAPIAKQERDSTNTVEAGAVAGAAAMVGDGMEIIHDLLKLSTKGATHEILQKIGRSSKILRIAAVVLAQLAADPNVDINQQINTLNMVASQARIEQVERQVTALKTEQGPVETQFQQFLDKIQVPLTELRQQFSYDSLPMGDPRQLAFVIAFANVFIDFDNEISRLNLSSAENYRERLAGAVGINIWLDEVATALGAPKESRQGEKVPLDDIDKIGIPIAQGIRDEQDAFTHSEEGKAFTDQLMHIFTSPAYQSLKLTVGDSQLFTYYERLVRPDLYTPAEVQEARNKIDLKALFSEATTPFDTFVRHYKEN